MNRPWFGPGFASYQTTSNCSPASSERALDQVVVVRGQDEQLLLGRRVPQQAGSRASRRCSELGG